MLGPTHYHLPNCDGRSCMCMVCTCGQHHCPGLMKSVPLEGNTHYRDTFTPKKGARDESPRKAAPPLSTKAAPDHFQTTYGNATEPLKNAAPDRAQSYRPTREAPPQAPFQGNTTQRVDYPGHQPTIPAPPPRSEPMAKLPGTYDTTLGAMQKPVDDAFKKGELKRPENVKLTPNPVPQLPFNGITSYTDHYPPKESELPRKASPRAQPGPFRGPDNRDFTTTKDASYKAPSPRRAPPCPATLIANVPPSRDGHIKARDEAEFKAKVAAFKFY